MADEDACSAAEFYRRLQSPSGENGGRQWEKGRCACKAVLDGRASALLRPASWTLWFNCCWICASRASAASARARSLSASCARCGSRAAHSSALRAASG